ncbi:hypothetical protein [Falsiroseomonas tokyonensis]|uniref:UrcA family protein n=1 Tax=Falsiroseomonas tokyonensis TaxID=430521 RepID=A0ABV7BZ91_9PROT|nr:hypothetical protein [Falsiroseomonas tokyonensis]MBU8539719.1 hypothetical protein [Falsiroseomonas tokyonensis]
MRLALAMVTMLAGPAFGQGFALPGRGASGIPGVLAPAETPQQQREFCQRLATAAGRCAMAGGIAAPALAACLAQGLPAQDSIRVAQLAQASRGSLAGLLSECGIGLGR